MSKRLLTNSGLQNSSYTTYNLCSRLVYNDNLPTSIYAHHWGASAALTETLFKDATFLIPLTISVMTENFRSCGFPFFLSALGPSSEVGGNAEAKSTETLSTTISPVFFRGKPLPGRRNRDAR